MYFRQILTDSGKGSLRYTYVLADTDEQQAVIIDPLPGQTSLLQALLAERDLRLWYVLRTHLHVAETARCGDLCDYTGARLVLGVDAPFSGAALRVEHGAVLTFGNELLRVLGTPGHTPDSVSYLWRDRLFCGDALEIGSRAATGDAPADPGRIHDSVTRRLFVLAPETLVFPAHDEYGRTVSTIAEVRRRDPWVAGCSRDEFSARFPGGVAEASSNAGRLHRASPASAAGRK